ACRLVAPAGTWPAGMSPAFGASTSCATGTSSCSVQNVTLSLQHEAQIGLPQVAHAASSRKTPTRERYVRLHAEQVPEPPFISRASENRREVVDGLVGV